MRRWRQRRRLRAPGPVPRLLAAKLGTASAPPTALLHPTPNPQASPALGPHPYSPQAPPAGWGGGGEPARQAGGAVGGVPGLGGQPRSLVSSLPGSPSSSYSNY